MKWFKHMTDAHDGKDLTKVRIRYGADGYAIYWYCLELIAADLGASDKITFELRHDAEVIGHNLKIDSVRVEEIMRFMVSLELFEQSTGTITCLKLAKYLDKKSTRNITIHKIIDSASLLSRTNQDKPGLSGLDRDTDLDIDVGNNNIDASRPNKQKKFVKPNLEEVTAYCLFRNNGINPQTFIDWYDSNGWKVGRNPMKSWQAAVRTWEAKTRIGGHYAKPSKLQQAAEAIRASHKHRAADVQDVGAEPRLRAISGGSAGGHSSDE
mgnify:CR=1 FL=1